MTGRRLQAILTRRASTDRLLREIRRVGIDTRAEPHVVGGYVRDAALRRRSRDLDLLCSHGVPGLIAGLRSRWGSRGFRFRKRGVTTWRFDVDGRQIDLVDASGRGLRRDLLRRELTINAIAFDLVRGHLVDPLRGLADLSAGRFRLPCPGAIREDPLRALRVARFLSQFPGFRLDRALADEARTVRLGLARASVERIRDELNKMLFAAEPHLGFGLLDRLSLTRSVLPELESLRDCGAGHQRPDVWSHTVEAIRLTTGRVRLPGAGALRDPDDRRLLRWSLLLHDISKPETFAVAPDGKPTFHGHETLGARRADALLRRFRMPKVERRRVCRIVLFHLRPGHLADSGSPPRGMRRLIRESGYDLPLLVLHSACDARASGSPNAGARWRRLGAVLRELLSMAELSRKKPLPRLLDGRDVMTILRVEAGPAVGRALSQVRERQEAGELKNRKEAIAFLRARRR